MADSVVDIEDFSDSMKMFTKSEISQLRPQLLSWYRANRRFFPWRGDAGDGYDARPFTAYGCWVSEIMLQQTRTDTVIPYWNRWMDKWPTVDALAAASPEEVNSLWAGLGYYRRAQQLLQGARKVVADLGGVLPQAAEQLQEVPGIGPYTAGAISSIAYRKVEPVVDGNVIRVLSRLRAIEVEMGPALTRDCWRLARDIVDPEHPGDFNQAMMELGATICKPLNPDCSKCPLSTICQARLNHEMNTQKLVSYYPLKAEKKAPKQLVFNVHVLYRKPSDIVEYLFIKRPSRGLLANQWEFPTFELNGGVAGVSESMKLIGVDCITEGNPDVGASDPLVIISSTVVNNPVVHLFSHQHHTMYISVHFVKNTADVTIRGDREIKWMHKDDMKSVGITTGVRKILASVDACVSPTKRYISDRNDSTEGKMKKPKFKGTEAEEMKEVHQQNSSKRIRKNKYEESELNCTSGDISSSGKMSIKAFFHPASKKQ